MVEGGGGGGGGGGGRGDEGAHGRRGAFGRRGSGGGWRECWWWRWRMALACGSAGGSVDGSAGSLSGGLACPMASSLAGLSVGSSADLAAGLLTRVLAGLPASLLTHALAGPSAGLLTHALAGLRGSLAPLPRSPAPPCTPCVEGRQRTAPHSSLFPPTTAPFQTLHLDIWGPSLVLGPRHERYLLIVVDDYSLYTTVFPLRWKANTFSQGWGIIQPDTLPASPQQNGVAERRIRLVMEVARTFMCHAGAPRFLWPQAVCYATHQLNLWPSDAWPRVTPVSLWTGSPGVAADFRVWGSLAHFFASQDVTFDESVWYYRSRPHRGVSHVTPQSPPPQCPVPVVSGGAGVAVTEGEGTGAAGAGGVSSRSAGSVGVEVTPVEDTACSTWEPRPASPPGFPSVPQFPSRSSLRPVVAEPRGVPAGVTGGPGGVGGGGAGSGGVGAGGIGSVVSAPRTVHFLTHDQRLLRWRGRSVSVEEESHQQPGQLQPQQKGVDEESRVQQRVQLQSQQEILEESWSHHERVEYESRPQQQVQLHTQLERVEEPRPQQERVAQESRSQHRVQLQPQQERAEEEPQEHTTTLPCPAAPSGVLIGYYTPSFSRNLVGFPLYESVAPCIVESLTPLPRSPAPPCTPCVEGRQRAAPHSSSFPPTMAPLQTLHLDVSGPSPILGPPPPSRHGPSPPPLPPPSSPPALSGMSHVTPQSSPLHRLVPIVSRGAGGAAAEGEGATAARAGGVGSGYAWGVGVEASHVEDMAASSRRPRPASPPSFPFVPQFPNRSSLQPVAAKPGGVPAGGNGGTGGVVGGVSGSRGAGAGGAGTLAPTPHTLRFLTSEQRLLQLGKEEQERFERARQQQRQQRQQ
ncbi:unnamed protein product [Closterium sp. NIES-54]